MSDEWETIAVGPPVAAPVAVSDKPAFTGTDLFISDAAAQRALAGQSPAAVAAPVDEWQTVAVGPAKQTQPLTAGETFTGGMTNLLSSMIPSMGDEIVAGGASLVDALSGIPIGQAYDQRLAQARDYATRYREENPLAAVPADIVAAIKMPVGSLLKKGDGVIKTAAKLGAEGGAYGAAYGFGSGEGGFDNRIQNAWSNAKVGAGTGAAVGAVAKPIGALLTDAKPIAESLERKVMGAVPSDFTKSARQSGIFGKGYDSGTSLKTALNELKKDGIFEAGADAQALYNTHRAKSEMYAKELATYLGEADKKLAGRKVYPKKFTNADKYITENTPYNERDGLRRELLDYKKTLRTEGRGTISDLQSQKELLYAKAYPEGSISREGLDKAIAKDIKEAIEDYTGSLTPQHAGSVKRVNKKLGPYEETRPIFERGIGKSEGFDPAEWIAANSRTSGGTLVGIPTAAGAALTPVLGPLAPAAGFAIGSGAAYLRTPGGKLNTAKTLRAADFVGTNAKKLGVLDSAAAAAKRGGALVAQQTADDQKQSQSAPLGKNARTASPHKTAAKPSQQKTPVAPTLQGQRDQIRDLEIPSPKDTADPTPNQAGNYTKASIKKLVKEYPPIVQAIVATESAFNHKAVSKKGAKGLMQLMDANSEKFGVKDPFDPKQNLEAGTKLLQEEMDRFKDARLAVAAFNAGSPAVHRAIAKAGSTQYAKVYPYLPAETRAYVPKVLKEFRALV